MKTFVALAAELDAYASKPSSRRSVDEGDDLMREAADALRDIYAENFKLAAGVCEHRLGNEHGNAYCGRDGKLL